MGTKTVLICDYCEEIIPISNDAIINGYIVQGNIYVVSPIDILKGNNFLNNANKFTIAEVKENVFCKKCFMTTLELEGEVK